MKWLISLLNKLFSKKPKVQPTNKPVIKPVVKPITKPIITKQDSTIVNKIDSVIINKPKQEAEPNVIEAQGDDNNDTIDRLSIEKFEYKQYPNLCVCLDPGHGAETPGKRSPYASNSKKLPALYFREYQFSREISQMIKEELTKYGVETFITVETDRDIALTTRYKRANSHKAENPNKKYVFISVHANAAGNGDWLNARGWSVWTTKGQNYSDKLATCLYKVAEEILPPLNQKLRKDITDGDPDYESNFTVIYGANMPAVLTENMFQDNVEDVKFLLSDEGKKAITDIHVKGILKFADEILKM